MKINELIYKVLRDFLGGPVVKTLCSQCRGPGFDPWSGNYIQHGAVKSSQAKTQDPTHATTKIEDPAHHN